MGKQATWLQWIKQNIVRVRIYWDVLCEQSNTRRYPPLNLSDNIGSRIEKCDPYGQLYKWKHSLDQR